MADATQNKSDDRPVVASRPLQPRGPSKFQQLNKIYELPAPLRTFPLPTFVPHNPLSLLNIFWVWARLRWVKPSSHFDPLYQGWLSPETQSIHVTDMRSIRGLWEQGFYGKGTLSRSEPSWLNKQAARSGAKKKITSEMVTAKRRAERQQTKWERARKEREMIEETLREEAGIAIPDVSKIDVLQQPALEIPIAESGPEVPSEPEISKSKANLTVTKSRMSPSKQVSAAPTGPLQLLALPNSSSDIQNLEYCIPDVSDESTIEDEEFISQVCPTSSGPIQLLSLPNSIHQCSPIQLGTPKISAELVSEHLHLEIEEINKPLGKAQDMELGGSDTNDESRHSDGTTETVSDDTITTASLPSSPTKRKSVRFSPTVEKTTFMSTEPPSPPRAVAQEAAIVEPTAVQNQEHLQLTLSEAFFLSYALGALTILDPATRAPIPNEDLFSLFRRTSYFPPRMDAPLQPDDPFMLDYVVYHHYRSLGWTPRSGIKFSVDYMLYIRGPVFTHAEFGVLILPSYSHPYWSSTDDLKKYVRGKERRTWHWLSCINRVIGQVRKTLILTYVDIPPPVDEAEEWKLGVHSVLGRYKVREVVVKRFSANRLRK